MLGENLIHHQSTMSIAQHFIVCLPTQSKSMPICCLPMYGLLHGWIAPFVSPIGLHLAQAYLLSMECLDYRPRYACLWTTSYILTYEIVFMVVGSPHYHTCNAQRSCQCCNTKQKLLHAMLTINF